MYKRKKTDLKRGLQIVALLLMIVVAPLTAKITMKPYLQAVTQNSIYVLAESDSKDTVKVDFSKDSSFSQSATTESIDEIIDGRKKYFMHKIKLSPLDHSSRYNYRVFQQEGKVSKKEKQEEAKQYFYGSFHTAMAEGSTFRFAIMGDCRSDTVVHSKIAKLIKEKNPLFSIYLGDLCFGNEYFYWKKEFFIDDELELISKVPFFNAVGNHEQWKPNTLAVQKAPESKSRSEAYYSFDYGDIHFLIINTEVNYSKISPQYKFIIDDLRKSKKKWKIVVGHIPVYCCGHYGNNSKLIEIANEAFIPSKVDIYLSGHSHFYQHNEVDKIKYLIVAGGGAPLYTPDSCEWTKRTEQTYNYAICDASPSELRIRVYNLRDDIIDEIILRKEDK